MLVGNFIMAKANKIACSINYIVKFKYNLFLFDEMAKNIFNLKN